MVLLVRAVRTGWFSGGLAIDRLWLRPFFWRATLRPLSHNVAAVAARYLKAIAVLAECEPGAGIGQLI